jgi:hypothetical protein
MKSWSDVLAMFSSRFQMDLRCGVAPSASGFCGRREQGLSAGSLRDHVHDEARDCGDKEAESSAQQHHIPTDRPWFAAGRDRVRLKRDVGTEQDDDIHDRSGEHVRNAARERKPLTQESPHDDENTALAHGEHQAEQAPHDDRRYRVFRHESRDELLRKEFFEQPSDERTEDDERQCFPQHGAERQDEIANLVDHRQARRWGGQAQNRIRDSTRPNERRFADGNSRAMCGY